MTDSSSRRRRSSSSATPITSQMIVDTAFRLLEERGGEGFSMRAVATELGVFPATLYWHVGDRAQLVNLVEERWISSVEPPTDDLDWRDWLKEFAHRFRANAHRFPNVTRLMSLERSSSSRSLAMADLMVGHLSSLGLGDDLVHAYNALVGGTLGFVVMELARIGAPGSDEAVAAESDLRSLDADQFPHIAEHFDDLADSAFSVRWTDASHRPLDASFDYFVDLLLDGIALRIGDPPMRS